MSKIVFRGQANDGTPYLIRYPKSTDLMGLWKYINELSKEKTYITFQGEEITLKEEKIWLNQVLKENRQRKSLQLVAESSGKIISVSGIGMQQRIKKHVGYFGISVSKEFRNKGIGKKIMEVVINEGRRNLELLKIIYLDVFENNPIAIELYESFGFKKYGKLPGGLLYRGEPEDEILMYKKVN